MPRTQWKEAASIAGYRRARRQPDDGSRVMVGLARGTDPFDPCRRHPSELAVYKRVYLVIHLVIHITICNTPPIYQNTTRFISKMSDVCRVGATASRAPYSAGRHRPRACESAATRICFRHRPYAVLPLLRRFGQAVAPFRRAFRSSAKRRHHPLQCCQVGCHRESPRPFGQVGTSSAREVSSR